jgi:hypothetical protein
LILKRGDWIGKGSILVDGATLGVGLELALKIVDDDDGFTITGDVSGGGQGPISIRIAPNDVGTYVIDARILKAALDGIAKLESEPNLALVWNEAQTQSGTVALFHVDRGIGCRGFFRENDNAVTWEILVQPKQEVVSGENIVSFRPRR